MALRIVVAGEIYVDQVMSGFAAWPQPGEEAFASALTLEVGGGAPHTAHGLTRLGWEVVLAGPIGRDSWVRARLDELEVRYLLMEHSSEPTGTTVAVSMPEDRTFFSYRGANVALASVLRALPEADHLHVAAACDASLLQWLCGRARTVSIDAGWQPSWLQDRDVWKALAGVSWFLPNEKEAECLTGERDPERMMRRFAELGIRAAIKLGGAGSVALEDGAFVAVGGLAERAPPLRAGLCGDGNPLAYSSDSLGIDSTGAGDCFDAGFLDSWLRGESVERSLRAGNICGALSTRRAGGMNGFPSREEMSEWLSK